MKTGLLTILLAGILIIAGCGDLPEEATTGDLSSLSISPTSASLAVGGSINFAATANYSDGSTAIVVATWSLANSLGTVSSVAYTAIFKATAAGTETITASYGGKTVSANITITATGESGSLASIAVSPLTATLRVNTTQLFSASGQNSSGEAVAISPRWSLSGDSIGTLTANGTTATLEITSQGTAKVNCTSGEVVGYADVTASGYSVDITVETDTYVDSSATTTSFEGATSVKAGNLAPPGTQYEAYFKYSLASLPSNITIQEATLKLYPTSAATPTFQIYNLAGAFTGATTWGTRPTAGGFIVSGNFTAGDYNNISDTDLLTAAKSWYTTPAANYGLVVKQDGAENGMVVILSKENGANPPMLTIEYT
ncbi:MAG: DNRLRE domain-containing protein, partial [Candidatus Margulisbacteria bacterium]|nr:DNRLRE domain-containing protein [Candidatus Margulisiibacteriota bacterium]